jgi:hypothetical protein
MAGFVSIKYLFGATSLHTVNPLKAATIKSSRWHVFSGYQV